MEFSLRNKSIKGLSNQYILDAIFDKPTQAMWRPQVGDIIVGPTGNIFVIGASQMFYPEIGGEVFFFGGTMAASKGCTMDTPVCYTMNRGGRFMKPGTPKEGEYFPGHSSWKKFRFVPYAHETGRMGEALRTKLAVTA